MCVVSECLTNLIVDSRAGIGIVDLGALQYDSKDCTSHPTQIEECFFLFWEYVLN